ncbi:hypothetical protein [Shinella sedimenti]|uniref:Uncharacterized protein n=1 Tax=Shinella sedimenti TaxID=2919913 RepID=A0ABT0CPN8_9HYPH|nr:hypothetical protein [Shinella sedimenti]MCJ8150569.1 hypothetical protein [Shinella sedimenti]
MKTTTPFLSKLALAVTLCGPSAAYADTVFKPGLFVRQTQHWDSTTNSFLPGAEEGEGDGCWQVESVGAGEVKMKLVSGVFKPWWADSAIEIGTSDTWFDNEVYQEANPGAAPLSQLRKIFTPVESCG